MIAALPYRFSLILAASSLLSSTSALGAPSMLDSIATQGTGGGYHTCALTTAGGVRCWGRNSIGQLGDGSLTDRPVAVEVTGLASGVAAVAAGDFHSCALTTGGGVKCWGYNLYGQLGDGSTTNRSTPVDVTGLTSGVAAIAAGQFHSCALTTGGSVKCWGSNASGQQGDSGLQRPTPGDVPGLGSGVVAIAASQTHSCAITTQGGVKCWGSNGGGQLGDNMASAGPAPVDVAGLASGVAAIAAGGYHTCALTTSGAMKCWGSNALGEIGDNTTTDRPAPVDVIGLSSGVAAIAAGQYHSCAATTSGVAKCWGNNGNGQIGDDSTDDRLAPVDVAGSGSSVAALVAGNFHTCAVSSSGGMRCWGSNGYGQVGSEPVADSVTAPAHVSRFAGGVLSIGLGHQHTCAVTTANGARCWGANGFGRVGDNTITQRTSPVEVTGLTSGIAVVAGGGAHTCALTTAGGVKCWGDNTWGQVGDNSTTERHAPADVSGLSSGVVAISAGDSFSCALTALGGVKCWGWNGDGELGDTTTTDRWVPTDVSGLTSGVIALSAGYEHACVLTDAHGVKCWGLNFAGQVGDGSTTQRNAPVDVTGLTSGVAAISARGDHTCALTTGGGVKCWGLGPLGDGTSANSSIAIDVTGLASGVAAIAAYGSGTCALTTGGAVKCWGTNNTGQVGDNTTTIRRSPVDVAGLASGVAAIGGGYAHNCALMADGLLKCWGSNFNGQLGDASQTNRLTPVDIRRGQAIAFAPPPRLALNVPTSLSATAGSGLAVTYDSWTPGSCTVSGNTVTAIAPSLCGLRASQAGNGNNAPARQVLSLAVTAVDAAFPDFNADGHPDIIWSNTSSGATYIWHMSGTSFVSDVFLATIDPIWQIQGVADFNGDGHPDVVWRNNSNGTCYVWYLVNGVFQSDALLFSLPPEWVIQGVADFNADGSPDFLMRNVLTGNAFAWFFDDNVAIGDQFLFNIDPSWKVEAVGDVSADAQPDLLFRNMSSGLAFAWNTQFTGGVLSLGASSAPIFSIDPVWEIVQLADWNGDGKPDLLFRNASTGVVFVWYLDGVTLAGSDYINQIDPSWEIVPRR